MTLSSKRSSAKRYEIDKVQMSGLALAQKRKAHGRLASVRDFAKADWEPWEHDPTPGPSAEKMNSLGFYCRTAAAIMARTKTQLVESQDSMNVEETDKLAAGLMDTAETLKAMASVTETAYLRLMCATAAHHLTARRRAR